MLSIKIDITRRLNKIFRGFIKYGDYNVRNKVSRNIYFEINDLIGKKFN
jgi:hypothetical protein